MSRPVAVYDALFERQDAPEVETLVVQGDTPCQAKNMAFVLIEILKVNRGMPDSRWRLRSLTPR